MRQHTPGPWHASGSEVYAEYVCNGTLTSRWIATVEAGEGDKPKQIDYANARLIASAPALLEILQTIEKAFVESCGEFHYTDYEHLVLQAIAKAEGEQEK